MSLGMVAQILSALFVLLSGVLALWTAANQPPMAAFGWLVGVLGLLGGLAWLGAATMGGKK